MAPKGNLRLATLNQPLYCELVEINGKQKLRGLKILTNLVGLFEKAGFNVSLVPVDEQTTGTADENGTYNGLYGAVQSGVSFDLKNMFKLLNFLKKAESSIIGAPLRIAESIGKFTPTVMDAANLIMTKREPVQVFEGTLYDCLTTLGPLNNLLLGVIVALILIFLSRLVSKQASWNFFAQLMMEHFVPFRPLSLQLTFMAALLMVRVLFDSTYSTDATVAIPPKLINSLEDLANSKLVPIWLEGDPLYLEFKEGVTKVHADVFNMGPKNRTKTVSMSGLILADYKPAFEANSVLYIELLTSAITKYFCKYKSTEICLGRFRIFISKPFSRTEFVFVYSKNTSNSTADALKKYANKFLEQSFSGNTYKIATDDYFAESPQCESEIKKGVEAILVTNKVDTKLVPWFEMICALIAAMTLFLVEILIAITILIFSVGRFICM